MKVTLRALVQKTTLMATAFILAVSTLTAAVPFILSQDVKAAPGIAQTTTGFNALSDWQVDRAATSGGNTRSNSSLELGVDGDSPDSRAAANAFYRTEGLSAALPTGTNSIKASLYLDPAWENTIGVRAGLWGVTPNPSEYPIIEFSNRNEANNQQAGTARFQVWVSNVGWTTLSTPINYGATYNFEIVQNPVTNTFQYYVNGSLAHSAAAANGPLTRVIFNNFNAGVANNDYEVKWTNFSTGVHITSTPELVGIDAYYVKNSYKGIAVDIKTKYLTDATAVEVKVDRANGGPVTKTAKQSVLNTLNTGNTVSVTAPIVIQQGTYNEAGSSSWNQPTATWNSITIPTNVTVTITYGNGSTLVKSLPLGATAGPFATLAEVMPLDITDPNFAIESPVNGSFVSGTQTIEAKISDTENDITKVLIGIPGEASSRSWTPGSVNSKITKNGDIFSTDFDTTTVADGPAYIVLRGTDAAGNVRYWNNNAGNRQHVFTVDNTDPTLKVNLNRQSYVTSGATVGPNQVPEIEAADLNFDRVDVIKDGVVVNSWARNGVYTERRAKIGFLAQGTYTIRAYDAAGNTSEDFVITIDKTGPVTEVTNATVLGDTVTIEGTVSDTTNLRYYYCWLTTNQTVTVDGHTFTPGQEVKLNNNADSTRNAACNTTWANGNNDFSGVLGGFNIPNVPDGSYTVNLVAYDLAGNNNAASPATYTFTLDRTAPAVAITSVTAGLISGTAGLDATIVLTIDGVDTAPFTPEADGTWTYVVDPAFAVGGHTVVATAYDTAGNERIFATSFTVLAPVSDDDEPEVVIETQGITFPDAFNPGTPDVQGDSDSNADVEGDSTVQTPAQAVNSDANQGKLFGLAWYWWLLIIAAAATAAWWIIAAVRRRNADA